MVEGYFTASNWFARQECIGLLKYLKKQTEGHKRNYNLDYEITHLDVYDDVLRIFGPIIEKEVSKTDE